ncbi:MAG: pantoate--beta-alanine ligase [Acidobacteriaceae bacterium]
MVLLRTVAEMRDYSRQQKQLGRKVAFVPTMGALHEGHLSLVRQARTAAAVVVVSIFVNPTQFGPNEDLSRYPRPFERDREWLQREGVDALFYPTVEEMYPAGANTFVNVDELSDRLDGASRPGHFRGVATVVSKLFHAVEPDVAVFGQKDAAQHAVIRRMVLDLHIPVEVLIGEIVRESDGLALSSRNVYLNPEQRKQALLLQRALSEVKRQFGQGTRHARDLESAARSVFDAEPAAKIDYIAVVDADELTPVAEARTGTLVAVAAWIGTTRLIDNIVC